MIHVLVRHKIAAIFRFGVVIIFASAWTVFAQGHLSVSSTTDGHGLFSYTFDRVATSPYIWEVSPNSGGIFVQSHGILDVISPPGWTATVDANEMINWLPTSGAMYLGQPPVTFSVSSSYSGAVLYDQPFMSGDYQSGGVLGALCTFPDHQGGAGGYETFTFLGPQVVPEPSCFALFSLAALFVRATAGVRSAKMRQE